VRINTEYADVHGGFGYGIRNAGGSWILEFADTLGLLLCKNVFYEAGF